MSGLCRRRSGRSWNVDRPEAPGYPSVSLIPTCRVIRGTGGFGRTAEGNFSLLGEGAPATDAPATDAPATGGYDRPRASQPGVWVYTLIGGVMAVLITSPALVTVPIAENTQ